MDWSAETITPVVRTRHVRVDSRLPIAVLKPTLREKFVIEDDDELDLTTRFQRVLNKAWRGLEKHEDASNPKFCMGIYQRTTLLNREWRQAAKRSLRNSTAPRSKLGEGDAPRFVLNLATAAWNSVVTVGGESQYWCKVMKQGLQNLLEVHEQTMWAEIRVLSSVSEGPAGPQQGVQNSQPGSSAASSSSTSLLEWSERQSLVEAEAYREFTIPIRTVTPNDDTGVRLTRLEDSQSFAESPVVDVQRPTRKVSVKAARRRAESERQAEIERKTYAEIMGAKPQRHKEADQQPITGRSRMLSEGEKEEQDALAALRELLKEADKPTGLEQYPGGPGTAFQYSASSARSNLGTSESTAIGVPHPSKPFLKPGPLASPGMMGPPEVPKRQQKTVKEAFEQSSSSTSSGRSSAASWIDSVMGGQ